MSDVDPKTLDPLTKRLHKLTLEWSQGRVSLKEIVGLSPEELFAIANQGYLFFLQGKSSRPRSSSKVSLPSIREMPTITEP